MNSNESTHTTIRYTIGKNFNKNKFFIYDHEINKIVYEGSFDECMAFMNK